MIISVPATSANLGPGFDTLGLALDFRNEFEIHHSSVMDIKISGEGANKLLKRSDNYFVKIFTKTFFQLTGMKESFSFDFRNKIPLSRGMGSSSAMIIGAIYGAYKMSNTPINTQKILQQALEYESHPDNIVPALFGGFNVSVLDSGEVISTKINIPNDLMAVMVIPDRPMSTKYSRTILPKKYLIQECVFNISRSSLLSVAFCTKNWSLLKLASRDRIHQDRRMKTFPVLFNIQKSALENGALMSTLSGSGSSIFSMCHKDDAPALHKLLESKFSRFRVESMGFDNMGAMCEV